MQKGLFTLWLLFILLSSFSQSITVKFDNLPLKLVGTPYSPPYEYSYGQIIYLENDIQGSGTITALTFYYNGISLNSRELTVYLGTTNVDHLDSINAFKTADMYKVFQGTIPTFSVPGPITIQLDSSYFYNDSNLIIAINETTSGLDTLVSNQFIGYYPGARNRGLTWGNITPWNLYYFDLTPGQYPTSGGGVPKVTLHGLTRFPCQSPKYVRFDRIVHDAARINWTPPDSGTTPTGYDIYYSTSRYKPSSVISTPYTTVDSFYTFTGLAAATWYYAWVRSRATTCISVWTIVDSFKTLCSPIASPSPIEPFNHQRASLFPPNCWQLGQSLLSNSTSLFYLPSSNFYWGGAPYKNNPGNDSAARVTFSSDSLYHWLISPPYNLGTTGNKSLEFDAALTTNSISNPQQAYYAADDKFMVVISTDEGLTWSSANVLKTFASPQVIAYTGAHYTIPLSSYSGIVRIGFYAQSTVGNLTGGNIPTLFIDNVKISEALPVKLLEFTGKKEGTNNLLQWRTATEQNNRGFELQCSINSIEFSTIGFVPTKANNGNSTAELSYNYKDKKPPSGGYYYRLKQVDFDGKFTYSNVVFIKGETFTQLTLLALFPNPTHQLLNIVLEAPVAQKVQIVIADLAGKTVYQQTLELVKGTNNEVMNVAGLAKGTYVVKIICSDGCEGAVSKFVKQ